MEKLTLTKLYETLAQSIGRTEAECLTNYVDLKVKDELNAKTEILATKVSVKEEIHGLRNEMNNLGNLLREEIHGLRNEMNTLVNSLKEDNHGLRNEMYAFNTELKESTHNLRNEMKDNTISLQRWMLATFITLVIMIMGLYATILFKY